MSKAVLISIRPRWCEKIASGEKTIEVRKTRPKLETPFKCYIYCTKEIVGDDALWVLDAPSRREYLITAASANLERAEGASKGNGMVIGEFTCDRIYKIDKDSVDFIFTSDHRGYSVYKKAAEECCGLCVAMPDNELFDYLGHRQGYGWHISNLKIYDTPKALDSFWAERICTRGRDNFGCEGCWDCEKRPPQSWCYVEETK